MPTLRLTSVQTMDHRISLYLDLARFLAALVVLFHHALKPPFYPETVHLPGRSAVIVFFVISGYVIAYVTNTRESSWVEYTVSRLARVYSVALPALLLTGLVYLAMSLLEASDIGEWYSYPFVRLLVSGLFLNQLWNLTVQALNNGPYWSLCYEVWYYVIFGVWCFVRPSARVVLIAAIATFVGPRILLFAPIWLLGVWLYYLMKRSIPKDVSMQSLLFAISLVGLIVSVFGPNPADGLSRYFREQLQDGYLVAFGFHIFIGGDWRTPSDYVIGISFALTVLASPAGLSRLSQSQALTRLIRLLSSYTFSIYLYHAPLLLFFYAVFRSSRDAQPHIFTTLTATLVSIVLLGSVTEHRKHAYVRFFKRILVTRYTVHRTRP